MGIGFVEPGMLEFSFGLEIFYQILIVLGLVFLNGYFVASEFALVSVRKTRIDELVKKGSRAAKHVQDSIKDLDTFISATQLGITLASLALGWVGEPALGHYLENVFEGKIPPNILSVTSNGLAIFIAFTTITILHIVLGELVPKTIALQKSEGVALYIIRPLKFFTGVFSPFIWILNGSGNLVLKLAGFKGPSGHQLVHSEEEIKMILSQSAQGGAIEEKEAEMVYSVLRFGDIPVKQIMVPRIKVVAFDIETPLETVFKVTSKKMHSRYPVYKGSLDFVLGFIHVKDLYRYFFNSRSKRNKSITVSKSWAISDMDVLRITPHVSEDMRIDDVLVIMQSKRVHLAVVDDDNGGTAGIVTLEDIVEKLTGEIHDEFETLIKIAKNKK